MLNDKFDIYIVIPLSMIALLGIFAAPHWFETIDNGKDLEVKYNCHLIKQALDRYAFFHNGEYPEYIFGGDEDAWNPESDRSCVAVRGHGDKHPPVDPLIDGGYLKSYPTNPFMTKDDGKYSIVYWTSGSSNLGSGDPRFGYEGNLMGNVLNDPSLLWSAPGQLTSQAYTLPDTKRAHDNGSEMVSEQFTGNPYYSMGGVPEWSKGTYSVNNEDYIRAFWPGEFFYRAGGSPFILPGADDEGPGKIWNYKPKFYDRYMLGAYGSPRSESIDCIRLTGSDGYTSNNDTGYLEDEFYKTHPYYDVEVHLSTPEVFGGGERGTMPTFPYYDENDEWIYGAPDGYPDGIVILLVGEGILQDYTKTIRD